MAPADILRIANVSDAQISPNGDWIVYTVSTTEADQTVSTLWLVRAGERLSNVPPTSRQPEQRRNWELPRITGRPLLPPGWSGANPRWSPDGKSIAFLSTHEGQHGIWVSGVERRIPHLVAAKAHGIEPEVVHLPHIGLDIDTPEDLALFLQTPSQTRAHALLQRWRIRLDDAELRKPWHEPPPWHAR